MLDVIDVLMRKIGVNNIEWRLESITQNGVKVLVNQIRIKLTANARNRGTDFKGQKKHNEMFR